MRRWTWILGGVAALLLLGLVLLFLFVPLSTLRDLAIIFLAFLGIVVTFFLAILLVLLVLMVRYLRELLERQGEPLLQEARQTLGEAHQTLRQVRGTARFVSERIVSPFITLASLTAGVRTAVETLVRGEEELEG